MLVEMEENTVEDELLVNVPGSSYSVGISSSAESEVLIPPNLDNLNRRDCFN